MRKTRAKCLIGVLTIMITMMMIPFAVNADTGSLSLYSRYETYEKGDSVRVVIRLSADVAGLASFGPLELKFDNSMFTFDSGSTKVSTGNNSGFSADENNGLITMTWSPSDGSVMPLDGRTDLVSVYFKAIKTGSGTFQITNADGFSDENLNTVIVAFSGVSRTIEVTAPVVQSSNNSLKSLDVSPGTLSPAFAAGTTSYAVSVGMDIDKLTVSAAPADSKATLTVSGNESLLYGDNAVKIVVTAENGDKKTYTITVNRAAPSPTPSPSPTPAATVSLPDGIYSVVDPPADMPIPGGFYSTLDTIGGQTVTAFKALKGDLTLFYLVMEGGDAGFYYLDPSSSEYKPFLALILPAMSYPVLSPENSVTVPEGYSATTIELGGDMVPAWQLTDGTSADQYLLYLMNDEGEKDFYIYNQTSGLLSLYAGSTVPSETSETSAQGTSETTIDGNEPATASAGGWQLVSLMLGIVCLILIGVIIWLIIRSKGGDDGDLPPENKAPSIRRVE